MILNSIFSERLKKRRQEVGMTAGELAKRTGISRATIHRYENGQIKNIRLPSIESIAFQLQVNPDWLLGKTDNQRERTGDNLKDVKHIITALARSIRGSELLIFDGKTLNDLQCMQLATGLETVISMCENLYKK